jgi:hypothetical protein
MSIGNLHSKRTLMMWQRRRAARSNRPNKTLDEIKTNGAETHPEAEALPRTTTQETSTISA